MDQTNAPPDPSHESAAKPTLLTPTEASVRPGSNRFTRLAFIAGVVVWLAFAILLVAFFRQDEREWLRIFVVFTMVTAVGCTAAGVFVGAAMNRERAERAEALAAVYQNDAVAGRALATALKAGRPPEILEGPEASASVAVLHARMARELFP